MAFIDELTQHLHNQQIGVLATNLFKSWLPEDPDSAIAVYETGGPPAERELPLKNLTFQVVVRNVDYAIGKAKLDAIREAFHGKKFQTIANGNTFFLFIYALAEGGHTGRDENGRDLFSINFICKTR